MMECTDITTNTSNYKSYAFTGATNENALAAPQSQQTQNSGQPKGDTLAISVEARNIVEQTAKKPSSEQEVASYTKVKQVTTTDGTQVLIEGGYGKDAEGNRQLVEARITFTGKDGSSYSYLMKESAVFTQDEHGQWQMHQAEGRAITGTDKDDVIIMMPKSGGPKGLAPSGVVLAPFNENTTTDSVDAGEGNNVIVDFSGEATSIRTGSGNDTIIGSSKTGRYIVDSGAGDDVIELSGYNTKASAGDGNDKITLATTYIGDVSGGDGDDSIVLRGGGWGVKFSNYLGYRPTIDGGAGDDSITGAKVGGKASLMGSSGNDTISISSDGGLFNIEGGDGNDNISIDTTGGKYTINGGNDDDNIRIEASGGTKVIHGGNGNDTISGNKITGGTQKIYGDDGNDHISIGDITGGYLNIDGGNGNDTIEIGIISGGTHHITGGSGDDAIRIGILGGTTTIDGGSGNNTITAQYIVGETTILGSQEKDASTLNILELLNTDAIQPGINANEQGTESVTPQKARGKTRQAKEMSEYEQQVAEAAMGIAQQSPATALRPLSSILSDAGITRLPERGLDDEVANVMREIRLTGAMSDPNFVAKSLQRDIEATGWLKQRALHRYGQQASN